MFGDLTINRFIVLVCMFVLSIIFLIVSPNLIRILLGWDGLGLVSYCLVVYYQNIKSSRAGMLTALSNRVGDVAILMCIAWILNFGRWNFIFYLDYMKEDFSIQLIAWLVVLAAFTKRAQIPFSSWLPAAMAAPTPVSSLVHSSTLVTAGVYLLIRFNFCLRTYCLIFILFISGVTIFIAGLGANFEFDLKKIIALSTLSQLGLMMRVLALGDYILAYFHLLTHALFKALLFICAGRIIHNLGNCQDIRFMGGLVNIIPVTCSMFIISNLSLCGLPFLSGFYSKDLVLEVLSIKVLNLFVYFIFFISTGLTVCYTFRLIYYVLIGGFNYISLNILSDERAIILGGMSGLVLIVIFGGSYLSWLIFPIPYFICLPLFLKLLTLLVIFVGVWLGVELSKSSLAGCTGPEWVISGLFYSSMWFLPSITSFGLNYFPLWFGSNSFKIIDQGWLEHIGGQNLYKKLKFTSTFLQFLVKNNLKVYFSLTLIWLLFLFLFLFYLNSLWRV